MDRIEAPPEQAGLRAFGVERDAERKYLAGADEARRPNNVLRTHVIERPDLVVLAPAAPVLELVSGVADRLLAYLDVHRSPSGFFPQPVPSSRDTGRHRPRE